MESHSRRQRRSNAAGATEEDRLSSLPDDLLHSILRDLPLKQAARTSALSRRWAPQWLRALAASPVIDLTDRDFARGQTPARAAATVGRCLRLHAEHGAPLDAFRVALVSPSPSGLVGDGSALGRDVVGCSLERLALDGFSLRAVRLPAAGLAGLRSLSLAHADVTDEAVRGVLTGCRALESLTLRSCPLLTSVTIGSERLRVLELLGCRALRDLRVAAPALESFAFHGRVYFSEADDYAVPIELGDDTTMTMPALRDARMCHLGFGEYEDPNAQDFEYPFLYHVAHARVLTLCSIGLLLLREQQTYDEMAYADLPNLEELQLLMATVDNEGLEHVSTFFMLTQLPVLQRLFVRVNLVHKLCSVCTSSEKIHVFWNCLLPAEIVRYGLSHPQLPSDGGSSSAAALTDDDDADIILMFEVVLEQLTFIKVASFRGTRHELRLLRFFLKRAPVLEQMVLVTVEGEGAPGDEHLKDIYERVSVLQKASREARVSVCRPNEDDSPNHAHTMFYREE
uniref:F-box domain-containing protein n=1 Tax=Setaria italica TaxID=4555 RepID=K3XGR8_SETIT